MTNGSQLGLTQSKSLCRRVFDSQGMNAMLNPQGNFPVDALLRFGILTNGVYHYEVC